MTQSLLGPGGALKPMADESAKEWFHWFTAGVYFLSILGALVSDLWLGKFKTIIWFSLVYCVGFVVLTLDHTRLGLAVGMVLVATGAGVIKPCVSANVGDQFGSSNKHLIEKVYSWFYFSINVGAAISMWYCPVLLDKYGPAAGFGVPGAFMVGATLAYWLGGRKRCDIAPAGPKAWVQMFDRRESANLAKIAIIFLFLSMFFALYYQSQSAWVLQAEKMELRWLGVTWLPAQMQAANSVLVVVMIPLFAYVVYPAINRLWPLTLLRKMAIGLFVTVLSFAIPIWVEDQIDGGDIFKCSSQSAFSGLEPVRLIDGLSDGSGWSSGVQPTDRSPAEIVIRLRERRSWSVSGIEIEPSTTLGVKEILGF
jgi:POT family proton-dependent oligopeptide transporter